MIGEGNVFDSDTASGGYSVAPDGAFFRSITARWTVAAAYIPYDDQYTGDNYSSWEWVGINRGEYIGKNVGANPESLIQVGVYSGGWSYGGPNAISYEQTAFFRWFPDPNGYQAILTDSGDKFPVNAGDTITAVICVVGNRATIYFANLTQNVSTSFSVLSPDGQNLNGNVAGCAVGWGETDVNISPQKFTSYGLVIFSNIKATLDNGVTIPPSDQLDLIAPPENIQESQGFVVGTDLIFCEAF